MGKLGFDLAEKVAEETQKKTARYPFLKVDDKPKQIRFITVEGDENSILTYAEHYVKFNNTWSRAYSCPDFQNEAPSSCIICKVKAGKNADVLENNTGNKFLMQVIERNARDADPETKQIPEHGVDTVKSFKFSPFLWQTLNAYRKENGTLGDRDYMISLIKTTTNGKTKVAYVVEPVTEEATPLTKADKVLILDKPALVDLEPAYDEADFNTMLAKEASGSSSSETINVKDTINEFLGSSTKTSNKPPVDEDEDVLASLPTVKSKPAPADDDDDDDDDNKEFFKMLKKK
jgi:hypothetical protein